MLFRNGFLFCGSYGLVIAGALICLSVSVAAQTNCKGGNTILCGASVALPDTTPVGNTATVHVPASVLMDSYATNSNVYFNVDCVSDGNGGAVYQINDIQNISCNPFPCQTSSVRLCNTSITIPGGTPMGGVMHLTMPSPLTMNKFTVQCIGSGGNAPVYEITDERSVSCDNTN